MVVGGVAILVVLLITVGLVSGLRPKIGQDDNASEQLASAAGSDSVAVASSADIETRYTPVEAVDGEVRWPLNTFDDGQAHYFSIADSGKSVDFFILKSSDGVVRAAHDACDVCFEARKGYRRRPDDLQ
jgi:hypothetical protein